MSRVSDAGSASPQLPVNSQQWAPENEDQVKSYIQDAMTRHGGNVQLAFADLRDQRQKPENYYNTNMAIAADYLRARWDVQQHGVQAESLLVDAYLAAKQTVGVPQEGPGPVSPYSDLEAKYMHLGVHDESNHESFWEKAKWDIPVPVLPDVFVPVGDVKAVWDNIRGLF
jgi:hypothetical protein